MAYWVIFFDLGGANARACFVRVQKPKATIADAAEIAWEAGCNPGGECAGQALPAGYVPAAGELGRLLTLEAADSAMLAMSRRA